MDKRYLRASCTLILSLFISGCASTGVGRFFASGEDSAASFDKAGSAQIAVLSSTPWDQAKKDMQPNFTLAESDALKAALPTTNVFDQKFYDALQVAARIALPTKTASNSVTSATSATGGTNTSASETTTTNASGATNSSTGTSGTTGGTSDSSGTTSSATKATGDASKLTTTQGTLATLSPSTVTADQLGTDPLLQYLAATALFQEVKSLDRYVQDAVVPEDATATVVRLQVSLLPKMRHLPYDAYTEINFQPFDMENPSGCPGSVDIVPLFVTDNLDAILVSRSQQSVQQFAAAVSAMVSASGVSSDASKVDQKLQDALGKDYNSTLTVSRLSHSTALVRFGAMESAQSGVAMVPKTNNVTLLVIYKPAATCASAAAIDPATSRKVRLTIAARTDFVDTNTGKTIPVKPEFDRSKSAYSALIKKYHMPEKVWLQTGCDPLNKSCTPAQVPTDADLYDMAVMATQNHWSDFEIRARLLFRPADSDETCFGLLAYNKADGKLKSGKEPYCLTLDKINLYTTALWLDLININSGNNFSYDHLDLSLPAEKPFLPTLPEKQSVLLSNGDAGATAVLMHSTSLKAPMLRATLNQTSAKKGVAPKEVSASSVAVDTGGNLTLQFPDVTKFGVDPAKPTILTVSMPVANTAKYSAAAPNMGEPCEKPNSAPVGDVSCQFDVTIDNKPASTPLSPAFQIATSSSAVIATAGVGSLLVSITATSSADKTPLFLKITGPEYAGCATLGGLTPPFTEKGANVAVSKEGTCRLQLNNLVPGIPLAVSLVDKTGKTYGSGLNVTVVANSPAKSTQ